MSNKLSLAVDGYLRCEKWMRNDIVDSKESKIFSWFERFIGRAKMPEVTWPFPFMEGRMFVLTVRAGVEGFHVNVGGRHITSFPYRTVYFSQLRKRSVVGFSFSFINASV